jgi:hypothetical protein
VLLERVEQRHGLQPVARGARTLLLDHAALVDRFLHARDDQLGADVGDHLVAVLDHLGEVVPGVHVHHREGQAGRVERLARQVQQHRRILASGEQQHPAFELGGDLTDHVDGLRLEGPEV